MGGFFGAVSHQDVTLDIFFGVDYHSHLGTRRGGMIIHDAKDGFQRQIHSIENTPFRTKFEKDLSDFHGCSGIGCISDTDPQPLLVRSHLGLYAITTVGIINNAEELIQRYFSDHGHQFMAMSSGKVNSTELAAALINQKDDLVSGILHAQEEIDGSLTLLLLTEQGEIIAARDRLGRLPVLVGQNDSGCCVSFESFAYHKLDYHDAYELGPREIVRITADGFETLSPAGQEMKICGFLWTYYGYPNSNYEGINVEVMRYRNGEIMARDEVARGQLPKVDDSIVRGTQLRETVEFLYESGAEEVHMRSACPPIMHSCKYLNFSRGNSDMDLLARRTIQELEGDEGQQHLEEYADVHTERGQCMLKAICEKLGFDSLGYQSLEGLLESIGLDRDKVCTYCWNGRE